MRLVISRVLFGVLLGGLAAAVVAGCSASPVDDASISTSVPPSSPGVPTTSVSPPWETSATTTTTSSPVPAPTDTLPDDLVPNVVDDECLLGTPELGGLVGRSTLAAENTELADGTGRRSCVYTDPDDQPVGRVDVYAPTSEPADRLVSRIAANSEQSREIDGVGEGAVLVTGPAGAAELVLASRTLLVILTVLPGAGAAGPEDGAWSAAASAMFDQLPP